MALRHNRNTKLYPLSFGIHSYVEYMLEISSFIVEIIRNEVSAGKREQIENFFISAMNSLLKKIFFQSNNTLLWPLWLYLLFYVKHLIALNKKYGKHPIYSLFFTWISSSILLKVA